MLSLEELKRIANKPPTMTDAEETPSGTENVAKNELRDMMLLRKGSRLSIQPVSEKEWACIQALKAEREKEYNEQL